MILSLLLAAQAVAAPPSPPLPPADWSKLPELTALHRWPDAATLSGFVRDEVIAGRCGAAMRAAGGLALTVDLAVLVGATGDVRRIVPRAIACSTVEQYAVGLVARLARDNVPATGVEGWHRATMTFAWNG